MALVSGDVYDITARICLLQQLVALILLNELIKSDFLGFGAELLDVAVQVVSEHAEADLEYEVHADVEDVPRVQLCHVLLEKIYAQMIVSISLRRIIMEILDLDL